MSVYDKKKKTYNFGAIRPERAQEASRVEVRAGGRDRKVDLRRHCSPVLDQGELPSCCACSIVSALEYLMIKRGEPLVRLSPMFIWYNARKISGTHNRRIGLYTSHGAAGLMAWGACEEEQWPYRTNLETKEPPQDAYDRATRFEAVQYARLGSSEEAKVMISNGLPVIFGTDMPYNYYESARQDGMVPGLGSVEPGQPSSHAMLAVGYDDDTQRWLVKNSWSERHGDKGYLHIPYEVLDKHVWNEDLWVIGELETSKVMRLTGPSQRQTMEYAQTNGPSQMRESLKKMGEEILEDLTKKTDDAKLSIRERLAAQERELEAKRRRDRGE